jgi:hypothetical protein
VGVEKLFPAKFAKIKSCQDAPQTTFSVFLDIFYPPNSCCFEENGVFQQPPGVITNYRSIGVVVILCQLRCRPTFTSSYPPRLARFAPAIARKCEAAMHQEHSFGNNRKLPRALVKNEGICIDQCARIQTPVEIGIDNADNVGQHQTAKANRRYFGRNQKLD